MQGKRQMYRIGAATALAACLALVLQVGTAAAFKTHLLLSSIEAPGQQREPTGVAVDEGTHHFYVTGRTAVFNFDPDGKLDPTTPELTIPPPGEVGSNVPWAVAIDNSGGSYDGYIYASYIPSSLVQQFEPGGAPTGVKFTLSSIPPTGTLQSGGLPPVVKPTRLTMRGLAVAADGSGDVFAVERESESIFEFAPNGEFIAQLAAGDVSSGSRGIAVGPGGELFVTAELGTNPGLFRFDASGNCLDAGCAPFVAGEFSGVALTGSGDLLVAESLGGAGHPGRLAEYTTVGSPLGFSGEEILHGSASVAIDRSTGKLVVADLYPSFSGTVKTFGPTVTLPDATTEAATEVTDHTATFHGLVGADEGAPATCAFQYVDQESFQADGFSGAPAAPCEPAGPFTGAGHEAVHAQVSGLLAGTTYHYRLLGTNEEGSHPGSDLPFTTHGPRVHEVRATEVTETTAVLRALVDPRGAATSYAFQYVGARQFEESGYANAVEVPLGGAGAGSGEGDVEVSQPLTGLDPGSVYHFRLLAQSADGSAQSADQAFSTYVIAPHGLPDDRAYEQASPVGKNGTSVLGEINAVQAAADGGAVTFFTNTGIPGGVGSQQFPSYLASRSLDNSGWSSQGLLPPASAGFYAKVVGWNPDLTEAFVSAKQRESPTVLYARSSVDGSLREVVSGGSGLYPYLYAGASADGARVLIESSGGALAPGAAAGGPNVYLWDRSSGAFVLAGVLNDGNAPAEGAFAGPYNWFYFGKGSLPPGGVSTSYYTQYEHAISSDGSRVIFTAAPTGPIYLRENPTRPQSALDSEGHCTEHSLACTVEVSAPEEGVPDPGTAAAFLGAGADGGVVYFLDAGKLTAAAPVTSGLDLYRYELAGPHLTDLTPLPADASNEHGADVQGTVAISADGSRVFFVANGVLAAGATPGNCRPGEPVGTCNLYVLDGGTIEFIARLSGSSDWRDWVPAGTEVGGTTSQTARISEDGGTLLFTSSRQLTEFQNRGQAEIYRYSGGRLECVSCNPTGTRPAGPASLQAYAGPPFAGVSIEAPILHRNISPDGKRIVFDSADKLVASDHNGVNDVYEWEAKGKGSCQSEAENGGCLFLISSGSGSTPSYLADVDESGKNIFFFTDQRLVGQDKDELVDLYDARVGGGIAAQNPVEPAACAGESCAGEAAGEPSSPMSGSSSFTGPGNPKPKQPKKKKHHKHKKKKHHKHKHHKHKNGGKR